MKGIIKVGYRKFVMPLDDAIEVMRALSNAEVYDTEYHKELKLDLSYIGNAGQMMDISLNLLSDDDYAVAKMRGQKPTDTNQF